MVTGPFRNSGGGEVTPGQSSDLDEGLGEGEITTGRPPQVEGDDGSKLTEAELAKLAKLAELIELTKQKLPIVWSELRAVGEQLRKKLKDMISIGLQSPETSTRLKKYLESLYKDLDRVFSRNTIETEELEIMIKIASQYRSELTADYLVRIAENLKGAVDEIAYTQEFPDVTKADLLIGLISLMVKLILSASPSYSRFRGREPAKAEIDHPNNAFLEALGKAANELVEQAVKAGHQELINAIFELLEMTKGLLDDELDSIYDIIMPRICAMINESVKNGGIDDNLIEQLANLYANYFAKNRNGIDQFESKVLYQTPPDLGFAKILSQGLFNLAKKKGNTAYLHLAETFNRYYITKGK